MKSEDHRLLLDFTGNEFDITPNSYSFDNGFTGTQNKLSETKYESLKKLIEDVGQKEPIYFYGGRCIDGFHRSRACDELGIDVRGIVLDPTLDRLTIKRLARKNTWASRNESSTELAIDAYREQLLVPNMIDKTAMDLVGLEDKHALGYIRTIADWDRRNNTKYVDTLYKGEKVEFKGKYTKSIKTLSSAMKTINKEDDSKNKAEYRILAILTEDEKDIFYNGISGSLEDKIKIAIELIELRKEVMELRELIELMEEISR